MSAHMWAQAVTTTTLLVLFSIGTKFTLETNVPTHAHDLLRQALEWRDLAVHEADAVLRLQHAVTGATALHAARTLAQDADLERASGVNVSRLARSLDRRVVDARQTLQAGSAHAEKR